MADTYKAVEATAPGTLRLVERPILELGPGQVRLRVEACGVCHTDTFTVEGLYPGLSLPRVPGHEVIGRGEALGPEVSEWRIGQRVGVGLFGGQDGSISPAAPCSTPIPRSPAIKGDKEMIEVATELLPLTWDVFVTPGIPIVTSDLSPGTNQGMWSPISSAKNSYERKG